MTPKTIECVIFDCDGTLVDSEILCNQGLVNVFSRYGAQVTLEECLIKYKGGKMVEILTAICGDYHLSLDLDELEKEYREELRQLFDKHLMPVEGVPQMLEKIRLPVCVASNGPASKMEHTLGLTGLLPRFEGKLFSAFDANCWKPDPGLLAYAAKGMGVNLANCVLVEDSVPGVMAGINAGISVFHYCRDEHAEPVDHPLVIRFCDMTDLADLITSSSFLPANA